MAGLILVAVAGLAAHGGHSAGVLGIMASQRSPGVQAASSARGSSWWYLTRTTAVAAYLALTCSVFLGVMRTIASSAGERVSWVVDELHAFIATLAVVLVVGHLISLSLDHFYSFTLINLLVPGNQPYKPLAVNLGVFALYAVVLTVFSSWLRRHFPYRLWRTLHYISFEAFVLVTAHGWLAGSDSSELWMRAIYVGASASIGFLALFRIFDRKRSPSKST